MHFVSIKTPEQMDLLACTVCVPPCQATHGVANQIRGFA